MMRTVVFFIKQILSLTLSWLLALKEHLAKSFSSDGLYQQAEGKKWAFLDLLSFDSRDYEGLSEVELWVSLEPYAHVGPLLATRNPSAQALAIESHEVLLPALDRLFAIESLALIIANISQIPCHREHPPDLGVDELARCHQLSVAVILQALKEYIIKDSCKLIVIDQRELLGIKNSALFERLFLTKK